MEHVKIFLTILALVFSACTRSKSAKDEKKDNSNEPIRASASQNGILSLHISLDSERGIGVLEISDIPEHTSLVCALDQKRLEKCQNGLEFKLPSKDGYHTFSVLAKNGKSIVAVGESSFSTGNGLSFDHGSFFTSQNPESQFSSDLTIELDDNFKIGGRKFQNGTWIKRNDETTFRFRFKQTPRCNPEVRCVSDSLANPFKPLCDSKTSKAYSAGTMARGLQYLRVEATCGDQVGPPLILYWYGVPDNYTYMALSASSVIDSKSEKKRYIFNLMKPNDCPENKLSFRCRKNKNESFLPCASNTVDNPEVGFAIMPVCNGVQYPSFQVE